MSTSRQIIPGETIPLEVFPELLRERARRLSEMVLGLEGIDPTRLQDILNASDEELRGEQAGDKFTYADLDRIFQPKNL